jgi:predicted homoserine dehydrogenase-like protein
MNFEILFADQPDRRVRYTLTGAKGGFARTLLAQTRLMPRLVPAALCDLDIVGLRALCDELGFSKLCECHDAQEILNAPADAVLLVTDAQLLKHVAHDILVEATGNPKVGFSTACDALDAGRHVAMVSKEVDTVVGVLLSRVAKAKGLVYTTADGDQPANLIGLISWARTLGLEIIAAGKSSEYDLVFDSKAGVLTQLEQRIAAPGLADLLHLGDDIPSTLKARRDALQGLKTSATADYCEMTVVATNTGLVADIESMHYPIARPSELADIYALREDGGIIQRPGVVDVFNMLRLPDEVSFAGGVFVVVRAVDQPTWQMLAQKGHVVSRNGRYACMYLPYHFMGIETPISLLNAVLHGRASGSVQPQVYSVLGGRAIEHIPAGTVLHMGGHHHDVMGVRPVMLDRVNAPPNIAPLYLAAHSCTRSDIEPGELILMDHLSNFDPTLHDAWLQGWH